MEYQRKCEWCGKEFTTEFKVQKYCGKPCCDKAHNAKSARLKKEKKLSEAPTYLTCPCCGKQFIRPNHRQVYCSQVCYETMRKSVARENYRKNKAYSKSVRVRRQQNMALIESDVLEALRLGMSYGEYQAMRERLA